MRRSLSQRFIPTLTCVVSALQARHNLLLLMHKICSRNSSNHPNYWQHFRLFWLRSPFNTGAKMVPKREKSPNHFLCILWYQAQI